VSAAAWTLLTVTVPASLTASFVLPNLLCNTSTSVLQFACPLVQYGKSPPDPWVVGLGVPRVVIPQGLAGQYTVMFARDHGLTLAEI
jgi:beta-lactamase regulating signal transducer with metallopeptidase domain